MSFCIFLWVSDFFLCLFLLVMLVTICRFIPVSLSVCCYGDLSVFPQIDLCVYSRARSICPSVYNYLLINPCGQTVSLYKYRFEMRTFHSDFCEKS